MSAGIHLREGVARIFSRPPRASLSLEEKDALIERYTPGLMRTAMSLGFSERQSETIAWETFDAVFDRYAGTSHPSRMTAFIFGILYEKAKMHPKMKGRDESLYEIIDRMFHHHFDADGHWNQESMDDFVCAESVLMSPNAGEVLQSCLRSLTIAMCMAFALREVEQLSWEEIGWALGLTTSALEVMVFRLRNKLRECMKGKGAVLA